MRDTSTPNPRVGFVPGDPPCFLEGVVGTARLSKSSPLLNARRVPHQQSFLKRLNMRFLPCVCESTVDWTVENG